MTIPAHYLELLCCPACRGDLAVGEALICVRCRAAYAVVDGIPQFIAGGADSVSESVAAFYDTAWKRGPDGELLAKRAHEDMSVYGQRYIEATEQRLWPVVRRSDPARFFLDAACGAQPRVDFGRPFRYHVCVDFSMDGLRESRRILGDRAICVMGSLLQLPVKDRACDGILASHCLYHIDRDLQDTAIMELLRVLAPGATLLILYANPDSKNLPSYLGRLIGLLLGRLRRLIRERKPSPPPASAPAHDLGPLYFRLRAIERMLTALSSDPQVRATVRPLRVFTRLQTEPAFCSPFGAVAYGLVTALEKLYANRPRSAYYLAYVATRQQLTESPARRHDRPAWSGPATSASG